MKHVELIIIIIIIMYMFYWVSPRRQINLTPWSHPIEHIHD
jgi:hypothetical protein